MKPPIRLGVIGCADIALRRMLPAFAAAPEIDLVAVASRTPAKASSTAAHFDCRAVTGYKELLNQPEIEAVYIPLPAALHSEWIETALTAGKHVLAEKPLTTDPRQTKQLLNLARNQGLTLMENVMFIHHPQHTKVQQLVTEGAIGELRAFHSAFTIPPPADGDIRYNPDLGGGALLDIGYYPLRAALHFLGPELEVVAAHLTTRRDHRVETSGAALLRAPEGVTAQITFGMENAYVSRYELWGSKGRISVDRAFTLPADFTPAIELNQGTLTDRITLEAADQVTATVSAFVAEIRAATPPADTISRQAALLDELRRRSS
ncbi:Gfo/Idh/MocA family oxidoreductase [Actinomadura meridiana]|uniref:Gfo/Idh/MocA family oxidoreductase n=1 Tax=Actinomadura meridiana TaxID=559626 RepID=A0ABP8BW81_9ACTN